MDVKSDYRKWRELVEWLESKGFDGFGLKVEPRTHEGEYIFELGSEQPIDRIISAP